MTINWKKARIVDYLIQALTVALKTDTLRLANETIFIKSSDGLNNQLYDGRINSIGPIRQRFENAYPGGYAAIDSVDLTLSNRPDTYRSNWNFDQFIFGGSSQDSWINRLITLKILQHRYNIDDALHLFEGYPPDNSGIKYDRNNFQISALDRRHYENIPIANKPLDAFTDAVDVSDSDKGLLVQLVFGRWTSTLFSTPPIRGYFSDHTNNTIRCSSHIMADIEKGNNKCWIVKQDGDVTQKEITAVNLSNASYTIASGYSYTDGDIPYCYGEGLPEVGATTTVATNPAKLFESILYYIMDIATSEIVNLTELESLTQEYECRRIVTEKTTALDIIKDLAQETNWDLRIHNGKYEPVYYNPSIEAAPTDRKVTNDDIIQPSYGIERDPEGYFLNRLNYRYNYHPSYPLGNQTNQTRKETWQDGATLEDDFSITWDGLVEKSFDFKWLYRNTDALTTAQRFLLFKLRSLEVIRMDLWGFLDAFIGDTFRLYFGKHAGDHLQIRSISKDLNTGKSSVTLWNHSALGFLGKWTDDLAPDWDNSLTGDQIDASGFWMPDLVINNRNAKIYFSEDPGAVTADFVIPGGSYPTPAALCAIMSVMMSTQSPGGRTYTWDYNVTYPYKFTCTANTGTFNLLWSTGGSAESVPLNYSMQRFGREIGGFDVSSDDTGAGSYTANYKIPFKEEGTDISNWS